MNTPTKRVLCRRAPGTRHDARHMGAERVGHLVLRRAGLGGIRDVTDVDLIRGRVGGRAAEKRDERHEP